MSKPTKTVCAGCGAEFEQAPGRGRPRKFCAACRAKRAVKAKVVAVEAAPAVAVEATDEVEAVVDAAVEYPVES